MFGKEAAKIAIETLKKWYQKIKNINDIPELKEKIEKLFDNQKIIDEITNKINNIQTQSQEQSLTSGVPSEEYIKQRDLKDKCEIELRKLKEENKNKEIKLDFEVVKKDVLEDLNNLDDKYWANTNFLSMISGVLIVQAIILNFPNTIVHLEEYINKNEFKKVIMISYKLPSKLKIFLKKIVDEWYEKNKY